MKNGMTRINNRIMPVPELCMQKMRALRKESVTEIKGPDTWSKSFPSAQFDNMLKSSCVSDHITLSN